jgi:hypothetical protein
MSFTMENGVKIVAFKAINLLPLGIGSGIEALYNSKYGNGEGGVVVENRSRRTIRAKVSSNSPIGWAVTDWYNISPDNQESWGRAPRNGAVDIVIDSPIGERTIRRTPFVLIVVTDTEVICFERDLYSG